MNILQMEDMVKGLPDQQLMQEAQMPTGQIPQFLTISEIQRRTDMRKRYQNQQPQPEGTVADQIIQEGIMGAAPPQQPPQQVPGMAAGGQVMRVPFTQGDFTGLYTLGTTPYGSELEAWQAFIAGQNEPLDVEEIGSRETTPVQFDPQGNLIGQGTSEVRSRMFADIPGEGGATDEGIREFQGSMREGIAGSDLGYYGNAYGEYLQGLREEPLNIRRHAGAAMDLWMPQLEGLGESAWDAARKVGITSKELGRGMAAHLGFETDDGPFVPGGSASNVERLNQLTSMFDGEAGPEAGIAGAAPAGGGKPPAADDSLLKEMGILGLGEDSDEDWPGVPFKKGGTGAMTSGVDDARPDLVDEADTQTALQRLLAMADVDDPAIPDLSGLSDEARKDAMNAALIQFGAGLASDDVGGGLRNAGVALSRGREAAREIEARNALLKYKGANDALDRDIGIFGRGAQIEATADALSKELMRQNRLDRRSVVQTARQMVAEAYKQSMTHYPDPAARLLAMETDYRRLLGQLASTMGVELAEEDLDLNPTGAGGSGNGEANWADLPDLP